MPFNMFPYSNFHKLNADWILKTIKQAADAVAEAASTVSGYLARLVDVEDKVQSLENSRVSYASEQHLTDVQKQRARGNIGAAPSRGVVYYNEEQLLSDEYKATARDNIGALSESDVEDVIRYSEQDLSAEQKAQARTNIGAVSSSDIPTGVVRYDAQQQLSDAQKQTARTNISAASAADALNTVKYTAQELTNSQKLQARDNIGAAAASDLGDVLRYSVQSLDLSDQAQARDNISAIGQSDLQEAKPLIVTLTYGNSDYVIDQLLSDVYDAVEHGKPVLLYIPAVGDMPWTPGASYQELILSNAINTLTGAVPGTRFTGILSAGSSVTTVVTVELADNDGLVVSASVQDLSSAPAPLQISITAQNALEEDWIWSGATWQQLLSAFESWRDIKISIYGYQSNTPKGYTHVISEYYDSNLDTKILVAALATGGGFTFGLYSSGMSEPPI